MGNDDFEAHTVDGRMTPDIETNVDFDARQVQLNYIYGSRESLSMANVSSATQDPGSSISCNFHATVAHA